MARASRSSLVEVVVDPAPFRQAAQALARAADGRELARQLTGASRAALEPVRDKARSNVLDMRAAGLGHSGAGLRQSVARATIVEVRQQGALAGARLRAKNSPMPRGFKNAPKVLDKADYFRHPLFGDKGKWVRQRGARGWFSDPLKDSASRVRDAITQVMQDLARGIAQRMG